MKNHTEAGFKQTNKQKDKLFVRTKSYNENGRTYVQRIACAVNILYEIHTHKRI